MLERLVASGNTVIVIEHNLEVISDADWVIDMGPGAAHEGGRVVCAGTPATVAGHEGSRTGQHLERRERILSDDAVMVGG